MRAIVRKFAERKANQKSSEFQVRGQKIDYSKMVRYFARKGVSIDDVMARRKTSATPEAVICFTPVTAPIATPPGYAIPESIIATLRDYVNGSFDSGTWIKTDQMEDCYSMEGKDHTTHSILDMFSSCTWEACNLQRVHEHKEAKISQDLALAAQRHLLPLEHPHTLLIIFMLVVLAANGFKNSSLAFALIHTMAGSGELLLGHQHPLPRIAKAFCRLNESEFAEVARKCRRTIAEGFGKNLGAMHS